ncbi:MAG TPA: LON peptidase substrate-binding domain-containing protein [Burkholderiales bacterium]|nr:LON peptidase substrate-binding domain-containing protein [Burkholderiales bacterium]
MALRDLLQAMRGPETQEVTLFPLHAVLLPGSLLPLKVFEQRYIEMTKACLRDNQPFGVCLIHEGAEVGAPAVPEKVGCLASIVEWDMQQLGIFHLKTLGTRRFTIESHSLSDNGLLRARVRALPVEPGSALPEEHRNCARVLRLIIDKLGAEHFQEPFNFEDAAWVSYRLTETLPLKLEVKQRLLELDAAAARLKVLHKFLASQGLSE